MKIQYNVYSALAETYAEKVGQLLNELKKNANNNEPTQNERIIDKISWLIETSQDCRCKAQAVAPIAEPNENPTLADVKRRAASINLTLREMDEGYYMLIDLPTGYILPPVVLTLEEISRIFDLSGVEVLDVDASR